MIILHDGTDAPPEGRAMEDIGKGQKDDKRGQDQQPLFQTDADACEFIYMFEPGKNAAGTLFEQKKNKSVQDHAPRNGRHEWKKPVVFEERTHGDFKGDPCDQCTGKKTECDAHCQWQMKLLVEPPGGVTPNKHQLPQRKIEDALDSIDQCKTSRDESG